MSKEKSGLKYDSFYRKIFSQRNNLEDLLRNALPKQYADKIDMSSIKLLKESFVDDKLRNTYSDMLIDVKIANKDAKFYILIEHKANYNKFTLLQMLKYLVRIWDEELRNDASSLTPIIPMLVYQGKSKWDSDRKLTMCFNRDVINATDKDFAKFIPNFEYVLFDLNQISDNQMKGNVEYMISVILMKYAHKNMFAGMKRALPMLEAIVKNKGLDDNLRDFIASIIEYINRSESIKPDDIDNIINSIQSNELKEEFMTLEKQLELRGEKRGRKIGEERGRKIGEERGRKIGETQIITLLESGKYSLEQIKGMTIEERDKAYKNL